MSTSLPIQTDSLAPPTAHDGNRLREAVTAALNSAFAKPETDPRTRFHEQFRKEADEYDRDFHKKYHDDLNSTLLFVSSPQSDTLVSADNEVGRSVLGCGFRVHRRRSDASPAGLQPDEFRRPHHAAQRHFWEPQRHQGSDSDRAEQGRRRGPSDLMWFSRQCLTRSIPCHSREAVAQLARGWVLHPPQSSPRAQDEGDDYLALQGGDGVLATDNAGVSPPARVRAGSIFLGPKPHGLLRHYRVHRFRSHLLPFHCRCRNRFEGMSLPDPGVGLPPNYRGTMRRGCKDCHQEGLELLWVQAITKWTCRPPSSIPHLLCCVRCRRSRQ